MYAMKFRGSFELNPYAIFSGSMWRKLITVSNTANIATDIANANLSDMVSNI